MTRFDHLSLVPAREVDMTPDTAPQRCLNCGVRATALCSAMNNDELVTLSELGRRRMFPAGQVISWAGDESTSCANIVSGALKVTATLADGREQIVGLLFPGDFVGQLFSNETELTVTTLTETDLCSYPRAGFESMLDAFPGMERMLLKRTIASLNDARNHMLSLGRKNAQERIAGFILELAERTGETDATGVRQVIFPISRGEMADFLGLTIETVSRQLTRLKVSDIISFAKGERDCRILDVARLKEIVNPL